MLRLNALPAFQMNLHKVWSKKWSISRSTCHTSGKSKLTIIVLWLHWENDILYHAQITNDILLKPFFDSRLRFLGNGDILLLPLVSDTENMIIVLFFIIFLWNFWEYWEKNIYNIIALTQEIFKIHRSEKLSKKIVQRIGK